MTTLTGKSRPASQNERLRSVRGRGRRAEGGHAGRCGSVDRAALRLQDPLRERHQSSLRQGVLNNTLTLIKGSKVTMSLERMHFFRYHIFLRKSS